MDPVLKQRVTGAAVLVALFVIFVPMFLDDGTEETVPVTEFEIEPGEPRDFSSRVVPLDDARTDALEAAIDAPTEVLVEEAGWTRDEPAEPLPPLPVEPLPPPADAAAAEPTASAAEPATAPAAAPSPDTSEPQRTGVAAWVVQLGSFSSDANARGLVAKLEKQGYTAFIEPLAEGAETKYRVRVGPELTKDAADRIRDKLNAALDIKGIVMRYP